MARAKKRKKAAKKTASKSRSKAKPASRAKKSTAKASKSKSKASTTRKPKAPRGNEIERCWKSYLQHRKLLERAVEEVQSAEELLKSSRENERKLRQEFNDAKAAFERLLEVEPATGAAAMRQISDVPLLLTSSADSGE